MDTVPVVHVDAVVDVLQYKDHALRQFIRGRHYSMKSSRLFIHIAVLFYVVQKVEPEFIQPKIHNGDSIGHILNINHFLLQAFELRFAVFQIALFFRIDQIIITGGCHNRDLHTGLNTGLQINVLIQRQVRPEIHKLNVLVTTSNTIDPSKTLDDAHRIPVNIIVDQVITVLQILTF